MSAKTKIVVLHMKELIYTGVFAALGILFIVLFVMMFLPGRKENGDSGRPGTQSTPEPTATPNGEQVSATAASSYIPGIYTTEIILGGETAEVEIIVDRTQITSARLINLSESVTTMYPLLEPTFESLCSQIYENHSLEGISYDMDNKYTSLVLLEAIERSLEKARDTTGDIPPID